MVEELVFCTRRECTLVLAEIITRSIIYKGCCVTLIDCRNMISQYIFSREYIDQILKRLFVVRIERYDDLLDLLKKVHFNHYFGKSSVLLITMLSDIRPYDKQKISQVLKRLEERYNKKIIILGVKKRWDIQSRLNEA